MCNRELVGLCDLGQVQERSFNTPESGNALDPADAKVLAFRREGFRLEDDRDGVIKLEISQMAYSPKACDTRILAVYQSYVVEAATHALCLVTASDFQLQRTP